MSYNNSGRGEYGQGNAGYSSYQSRGGRPQSNFGGGKYSSNPASHGRSSQGPQQRRPFNKDRGGPPPRSQLNRNFLNVYNQGNAYSQQNGDANQLWMGDLDPTWDESTIKQIWATFGETPVSVKIMKEKPGDPSRAGKPSYCFVTFSSERAASTAITKNGLQVPGYSKAFRLNWASGGASRDNGPSGGSYGGRPQARLQTDPSVFVGDLGAEVNEAALYAAFNQRFPNQIKQVKVMTDSAKVSKGFGFVRFYSSAAQQSAIEEMSGVIIGSRPIRVGPADGPNTASTNGIASLESKLDSGAYSKITIAQLQPNPSEFTDPHNTTVTVKGLSSKLSETELATYFISFGDIVSCNILSYLNEGTVKFYTRESAEAAVLFMHGFSAHGCRFAVGWGRADRDEDTTAKHTMQSATPSSYGKFAINNIRFDALSEEQVERLESELFEESEPSLVDNINSRYLASKASRDDLLRSSF